MTILLGIMLSALAFFSAAFLGFMSLKWLAAGFDSISWSTYAFVVVLLLIMPSLFITMHAYFLKRSLSYPVKWVRYISVALLAAAIIFCLYGLVRDYQYLLVKYKEDSRYYFSMSTLFLGINFFTLFFIAMLQAAKGPEEKDWMEKYKSEEK